METDPFERRPAFGYAFCKNCGHENWIQEEKCWKCGQPQALPRAPDLAYPQVVPATRATGPQPEPGDLAQMNKQIGSWTWALLIWGGLAVLSGILSVGGLDPVWGVVMIGVACLSVRVRVPAMFILYGVFMGWAALMNGLAPLFSGGTDGGWLGWPLAGLQVYGVISCWRHYWCYRQLALPEQEGADIAGRFAAFGLGLGLLALVLSPCALIGGGLVVALADSASTSAEALSTLGMLVSMDLAALGFGLSWAAVGAGQGEKGWAIGGGIISGLVLLGWLALLLVTTLISPG